MDTDSEKRFAKSVALGVTGSIAAYKAADLTSRLVKAGLDTHVIMTESATRLVCPQTFLTLSRNRVTTSLWDVPDWRPEHIALADQADVLLIAPATANIIAKLAYGVADDALSTFALSFAGTVMIAPAMNPRMWRHPAVQRNCDVLRDRGARILTPSPGRVACGDETGPGRLAPVEAVFNAVQARLAVEAAGAVADSPKRVLVTAGPTREFLDPARYLTNRSSGKMGYALAEAAVAAGHDVILVSGPVDLEPPIGARVIHVTTAAEMTAAVRAEFAAADTLFMSGAVADYRPAAVATEKLKKRPGPLRLDMERTVDILISLEDQTREHTVVGFAAETDHVEEYAKEKLTRKHLDWIVANDISRSDIGFGTDENEVTLHGRNGQTVELPRAPKIEIAAQLLAATLDPGLSQK
ncbi:MAG: bifunctional phosphopantothenoylcysteine decarboxylase/phosphopantothenate--cysteine ligase CoaBC [Lentisphaeria bacterium]|nr:bifunctional phosphopantothenoylcysteine decarboxylase/phosphopantothenate--cysteine ligase CoaBC [Lentisphaeria bacterium]